MAKILLLDYEKEDYELLQERNYDVEFAETNWKSLTTDILIVPKNCRVVFYQLNSENPASGLHSEDTEKFQKIIDQGGAIICFIGRCKQFQLTNFTGEYPNLDMQNYDIPNPIDSIQEPPFDRIFKEYSQFISYANTLFNVVLPVGETISMAAWDPNLDEKLTVLATGADGLPLSVKIQREKGFFIFLPWFGDHNNTITELFLDHILPEAFPHLFEEEAAPAISPKEPKKEIPEEESLPDLSEELEAEEVSAADTEPTEEELPDLEETEAPSAEAESVETETPEKSEDLYEPSEEEEEESWEEPKATIPEIPEEPPKADIEDEFELEEEKSEGLETPEEETPMEEQIEIEEEEESEDLEIPESEFEPSPEGDAETGEKTLEDELEIEEELEFIEETEDIKPGDEEDIPSWEEEASPEAQEIDVEVEETISSEEKDQLGELEEGTPPPEEKKEETKTGFEEQEIEEAPVETEQELEIEEQPPAEEEPAPPEEIEVTEEFEQEEGAEIPEVSAEETESRETQPEEEAPVETQDDYVYEQKSIPDTVLLEEEEKTSETIEAEIPPEAEEISPPVEAGYEGEKEEQVPWIEKDEYMFPSVKEISDKLEEERIKYEEKMQKLLDSMNEIKEKEQIVFAKLLTAEGEELKQAVLSTLEYLGGKKVIDVRELWKDEERGPEEDIWLLKDDKKPVEDKIKKDSVILVTVKSSDEGAKDDECSSIQKYKGRRMQEFHNTDMKAILIGNYYRQVEPKLRKNPFSDDQIAEAKIDRNALLTTYELFQAIQAEKRKKINKAEIVKQLETKMGLISFEY